MVFSSVSTLLFIAWHFETTSAPREREKHLGTFSVHIRLMVLELASLEKKRKKENDDFRFFQNSISRLAERKSEDIFVLRRVRAFHRYPFC